MSRATIFDSVFYLQNNRDVNSAVTSGDFEDAAQHFLLFGGVELRAKLNF